MDAVCWIGIFPQSSKGFLLPCEAVLLIHEKQDLLMHYYLPLRKACAAMTIL